MKSFKRILAALMVVACVFALVPANGARADGLKKKYRTFTGSSSYIYFDIEEDKELKSVTTSSKDMIAKITSKYYSSSDGEVSTNSYTIATYCEKDGEYTLTLNFSDKSKTKITVYNYPYPNVSIKVDGKEQWLENTSKKEVKVKVSMDKGNTIEKVEYVTAKKIKYEDGSGFYIDEERKTFKNGGKVPINRQPWASKSSYKDEYDWGDGEIHSYISESENEELFAYTNIVITYKDKYTKESEEYYTSIASVMVP